MLSHNEKFKGRPQLVLLLSDFRTRVPEIFVIVLTFLPHECNVAAASPDVTSACFPGRQLGKEEETRLALSISLDVEANPLPEAPTADFPLVSLARTGHMAAPSCKWVWETTMGLLCLAQANCDLSPWG